jgi:hypothetical protein
MSKKSSLDFSEMSHDIAPPPKQSDVFRAIDAKGGHAARVTNRTVPFSNRVTPQFKQDFGLLAAQQGVKKVELLEQIFEYFVTSGAQATANKKTESENEPLPKDKKAGRIKPLTLWGNAIASPALEELATHQGLTPSELLEDMIAERIQGFEAQGVVFNFRSR